MKQAVRLASQTESPFWAEGQLVADRYRIQGCNRLGGACLVFKALDTWMDPAEQPVQVAIKTLRPEWSDSREARNALKYELRVLRAAFSPGVVRAHDIAVLDGHWSLLMDWVPGAPLGHWMQEQGSTLSVEQRFGHFLGLLKVVTHLHEQGIVHGDIKPSNIIVKGRMQVILADFGLARLLAGPRPPVRLRGCTPDYTLPDRHRAEPASILDDQYACLCVLSRMIFGTPCLTEARAENRVQARLLPHLKAAWSHMAEARKPVEWAPFVKACREQIRPGRGRWRLWSRD
ncbi:MAG: hypothetical protein D6758_10875 [Gammaproteobacteria bacterium]|nr:MAG: hypothetical protein D6758_10875 [Gammaproteobacteria bacterium]